MSLEALLARFTVAHIPVVFGPTALSRHLLVVDSAYHVIYESRLELANLLLADYDQGVREISAQPFLLRAAVEGRAWPTFRTIYSMATVDPLWWMSFVGNGCRIRKSASCVHGPVR